MATGTQIPVICETPGCGTVWFSTSLIGIGQGSSATLTGNKANGCPECGGWGRIPDGLYTGTSASLFDPKDLSLITTAIRALRARALQGANRGEIEKEIREHYPFLLSLTKFLPKDASQLAAYLTLLFSILTYMATKGGSDQPANINVQVEIHQIFEQASGDLQTNPLNTQEQNKKTTEEKTQKY